MIRKFVAQRLLLVAFGTAWLGTVVRGDTPTDRPSRMYEAKPGAAVDLPGDHHVVFRGVRDESGYNNHAYLAHHDGRFFAIWSSAPRDGGHAGQQIRWAVSDDGAAWSDSAPLTTAPTDGYFIARGLWLRDVELLALAARCSGEAKTTVVEALEAYAWNADDGAWRLRGDLGREIINNYPPIALPSGEWLVPYRYRALNRVDGVMIGGTAALDAWQRIPFPGNEAARFTEANAVVRADGTVAVHLRDNEGSGMLFRTVSDDGGRTFYAPTQTDFPDCRCKHFCLRLSNGSYVLINNPSSRKTLTLAASRDGIVFTQSAIVRRDPSPVRNPGHDKSPSFTYPHAIEHAGRLWIIYAANRDDIVITSLPPAVIEKLLP